MSFDANSAVAWLDGTQPLPVTVFGGKATNLNRMAASGLAIPKGFAIGANAVCEIAEHRASSELLSAIEGPFKELFSSTECDDLIVRSSSQFEDQPTHQFFGLFRSIPWVKSFAHLISAIREAYAAATSKTIGSYLAKSGISRPRLHLGLIVQEHLAPTYSAVAVLNERQHWMIESFRGSLATPISGFGRPTVVETDAASNSMTILQGADGPNENGARRLAAAIDALTPVLTGGWQRPLMLEVAQRHEALIVLQVRELSGAVEPQMWRQLPSVKSEESIGRKAAAMKLFANLGLFQLPLCVLDTRLDRNGIEEMFSSEDWSRGPFTVRFSHGTDLGLPRLFVPDRVGIVKALDRYMKTGWAAVVHPYFEVLRSFELLLTNNGFLLEHVPGMWESENKLQPDVLHMQGAVKKAWLWKDMRSATYAKHGNSIFADSAPVEADTAARWLSRLLTVIDRLRLISNGCYPTNFHFIEDSLGNWQFLNMRTGFGLSEPCIVVPPVHTVSSVEDLKTWDGVSSILLKVSTNRGREKELLPLADALPRGRRDIMIDSGLLSHPAMILKEAGINLVPSYWVSPQLHDLQNYHEVNLS